MSIYDDINKKYSIIVNDVFNFDYNFIDGATFNYNKGFYECHIKFFKNDFLDYQSVLKENHWAKTSKKYFVDWRIEYTYEGKEHIIYSDFKGRNVFISFESSALGDTLAWIPYVDEFRKKHECNVICSTFHNYLFQDEYPEIKFVAPGTVEDNLYALYRIGWFYDERGNIDYNMVPTNFRIQPLQKTASDILGLEFKEIKPKIKKYNNLKLNDKLITIAIHGTTQAKYWNNPYGWQELVDYLLSKGYEVCLLSKEHNNYMGNKHPLGVYHLPSGKLEDVINKIQESRLFIGIGSGLSWLSWALNKPTVLISGFSFDYTEPQNGIIRINAPEGKCSGCFNTHRLDPSDWNWCPIHKNTERQFECTKSITAASVIEKISEILLL